MEIAQKNIQIAPMRILSHIRKNHALEHATIHILTKSMPNVSFAGYSFTQGFWIYGNAELQGIQKAVEIAHARLKNGEAKLAIHPNCGTNIAVTALCSAAASMLTVMSESDDDSKLTRFSGYMTAGMLGALAARPLGPKVQQYLTTDPNVSDISIVSITCNTVHGTPVFFVKTEMN